MSDGDIAQGQSIRLQIERSLVQFRVSPYFFYLGQDTAELFFEDLRVPASAVLGGEAGVNRGFGMLMGELPRERLLIGVQAAATMEAAFEFTREYVNERKAFGKTIVSTIQFKV